MIKASHSAARLHDCNLSFALVYPDKRGKLVLKELGSTNAMRRGPDDLTTLIDVGLQAGDYIDVALRRSSTEPTAGEPLAMEDGALDMAEM